MNEINGKLRVACHCIGDDFVVRNCGRTFDFTEGHGFARNGQIQKYNLAHQPNEAWTVGEPQYETEGQPILRQLEIPNAIWQYLPNEPNYENQNGTNDDHVNCCDQSCFMPNYSIVHNQEPFECEDTANTCCNCYCPHSQCTYPTVYQNEISCYPTNCNNISTAYQQAPQCTLTCGAINKTCNSECSTNYVQCCCTHCTSCSYSVPSDLINCHKDHSCRNILMHNNQLKSNTNTTAVNPCHRSCLNSTFEPIKYHQNQYPARRNCQCQKCSLWTNSCGNTIPTNFKCNSQNVLPNEARNTQTIPVDKKYAPVVNQQDNQSFTKEEYVHQYTDTKDAVKFLYPRQATVYFYNQPVQQSHLHNLPN